MITNIAAYHFARIEQPEEFRALLRKRCDELSLRGSILVAPEGLNMFLAGSADAIEQFLQALRLDPKFSRLHAKYSYSENIPFKRMKVKLKKEIITFRNDAIDPLQKTAPVIAPDQLKRWLDAGHDDQGRPVVLLDTRNVEEVAMGTFEGAVALPITHFTQFAPAAQRIKPGLDGCAVVSFCTGGIRCEKAAVWMQEAGFEQVYQLDGGILNYFEKVGADHYQGDCFVFDERIALKPDLSPVKDQEVEQF